MRSLFKELRIYSIIRCYCLDNGRYKELEQVISTNLGFSYLHSRDIVGVRFELGEDLISQDTVLAYNYAFHIIKGRWPKGEDAINKRSLYREHYQEFLESL